MNSTFLEQQEINSLTNRLRRGAQANVLRAMCIEYKKRPDGSIAILRAHVLKAFGGEPAVERSKRKKEPGPNWAAI